MFGEEFQEQLDPSILSSTSFIFEINESSMSYTIPYEIRPGKFVHINSRLDADQQKQLVNILKEQSGAFPWEYTDKKGNTLTHASITYIPRGKEHLLGNSREG
jgi:hypothetical protein